MDENKVWVVIDTRCAASGIDSGISRFIVQTTEALVEYFSNNNLNWSVLLIGKEEPPVWAVSLLIRFPKFMRFWAGGPGVLKNGWNRPRFAWSSAVFKRVDKLTKGRFVWIAPANIDRPIFASTKGNTKGRDHIIQVVHDVIAFNNPKSVGFIYRNQFKFLVKRTLRSKVTTITPSNHSKQQLMKYCGDKFLENVVNVVHHGVNPVFGSSPKADLDFQLKSKISEELFYDLKDQFPAFFEKVLKSSWVLAVGREEKYKRWPLALQAIKGLQDPSVILVRVGLPNLEGKESLKLDLQKCGRNIYVSRSEPLIYISALSESSLAKLYQSASALIHPSVEEGFGFPPIEALLSGLPVIYSVGTAIDEFFEAGTLPTEMWHGMTSIDANDWVAALKTALAWVRSNNEIVLKLRETQNPREVILKTAKRRDFVWGTTARELFDVIKKKAESLRLF